MFRSFLWAMLARLRLSNRVVAENRCLRQQLIVLQRSNPRPRLRAGDRRFWVWAGECYPNWREALILVRPETVLRWHRPLLALEIDTSNPGRPAIGADLCDLIERLATGNPLWGQRRIQAELKRLGYRISARTVAKYMKRRGGRTPSPGWRTFLKHHAERIWACDLFCVQTVTFRTLYVFFIMAPGRSPMGVSRVIQQQPGLRSKSPRHAIGTAIHLGF